ncbi:MAG: ABC transporter permease [Clostridia bacterium]|nr:ABC transporter permease [Clostridia bacterium]
MNDALKFPKHSFGQRVKTMMKVDVRRMLKSKVFYILLAVALIIPIVMTVMMTMMAGKESTDPQTGEVTVMEGPESVWESIGTLPTDEAAEKPTDGEAQMGDMDVMAMCNINMAFMGVCVFVCLFISDDFRSGYAKNLFTVRAKKGDYVVSKTVCGFICGSLMLIFYFIGALLGGAISGLSFGLGTLNIGNIIMCMLSKIFLMLVFVSIFTLISVSAKQKAWLSICGSLGGGMLLFTMVGMITPLNSTVINVILTLVGGLLFAVGLGVISKTVLKKSSLV